MWAQLLGLFLLELQVRGFSLLVAVEVVHLDMQEVAEVVVLLKRQVIQFPELLEYWLVVVGVQDCLLTKARVEVIQDFLQMAK
jgi:hypothetical protein